MSELTSEFAGRRSAGKDSVGRFQKAANLDKEILICSDVENI